jgi:hypothetical protein
MARIISHKFGSKKILLVVAETAQEADLIDSVIKLRGKSVHRFDGELCTNDQFETYLRIKPYTSTKP